MHPTVRVMELSVLQELTQKCKVYLDSGRFPVAGKPESLTKQYLVEPMLGLLGWSKNPSDEFHHAPEFSGGMEKKWEDIVLMRRDMPLIFVETKSLLDKKLLSDLNVNELLSYLKEYNRKNKSRYRVDWGVLTNFKELHIFYLSDKEPFYSGSFDEFTAQVTTLEQLLSVEGIKAHGIDLFYSETSKENLGDLFLTDLKKWRLILANGFSKTNPSLTLEQIKEASQQVLDRFIFIRMLETYGILPSNWLGNIFSRWHDGEDYQNKTFAEVMREKFAAIEDLYDTELFKPRLCDEVPVDDEYLEETLKILGPAKGTIYAEIGFAGQSSLDDKGIYGYNFNTMRLDIIGSAYERYLAHKITRKGQLIVIEETPEERRKEGTYFTPSYVVDHVVRRTVEPMIRDVFEQAKHLLAEHKFNAARQKIGEISSFRVLDPASGSGSFLVRVFDVVHKCYTDYNREVDTRVQGFLKERGLDAAAAIDVGSIKVAAPGERVLLENLYGVDFDPQAVEIAKLNLWIRVLRANPDAYRASAGRKEKGKLLPSLMTRIKCGNSLFSPVPPLSELSVRNQTGLLASLIRTREELSKIALDLSPASTSARTRDEINNLRRALDSLSDEERRITTTLLETAESEAISGKKRYFKIEEGKHVGLQGQPFAWQIEFPEVFFDSNGTLKPEPGFDVVIGNPPHGAYLNPEERDVIDEGYTLGDGYKNTAFLFIERGHEILRHEGYLSLVIPKSLTFSQEWEKVRKFTLTELTIGEIADISKAFKGVLLEQVVLTTRKSRPSTTWAFPGIRLEEGSVSEQTRIPTTACMETGTLPIHAGPDPLRIYQKIRSKSAGITFGSVTRTCRGFPMQGSVGDKPGAGSEPMLRGDEVKPYMKMAPSCFIKKKELDQDSEKVRMLRRPKILSQNIVAHVLKPRDHLVIMSVVDEEGMLSLDTVMNTIVEDASYPIHYLNAIMNSKLTSWFTYVFTYNKAVRTMHFDEYYINKIPIAPTTKERRDEIASISLRLHKLVPRLARLDVCFPSYVNRYPRIKDRSKTTLHTYSSVQSLVDAQSLSARRTSYVTSDLKREVGRVSAKVDSECVVVFAQCSREDGSREQTKIMAIRIEDPDLRQFICHSVNWADTKSRRGNVLSLVLETSIPRFEQDASKNSKVVREVVKEYSKVLEEYRRLAGEIDELERKLNDAVYDLYGLDEGDRKLIEEIFQGESVLLSLFPKPRG